MFVVVAMMRVIVVALAGLSHDASRCEGHQTGDEGALDEDPYVFHVFSSVFKTPSG
jgi:hypothetical protein